MAGIYNNLSELIGGTPLLDLKRFCAEVSAGARIVGKLEYFNPLGSVKDRPALAMILDAEERGVLKKGGVIIEPTSGNTGIALAFISASRGYRLIVTMPDTMSIERRNLLKALGAEVVLTPGKEGMSGAVNKALELHHSIPGSFVPQQFKNPANPKIHYLTTGREIWEDTEGKVDVFVSGVGTGGTISGAGRYLKEMNPAIRVIAVEPADSPVLSGGEAGPHKIQGIGAGFIPEILDRSVIDEIIKVTNEQAYSTSSLLAKTEGLPVGISSGAAAFAAAELSGREEYKSKLIVALLPDTGERYLSSGLYD